MKKEYRESEIRAHYRALTLWLIEQKLTITTMESATAGQIASLITDTEGSSAVLKGAFVTYCNEAKIQQGVPADVIDTYTVYSKETAAAMAEVCRESYQADIGVGVTGTMGNIDPATGRLRAGTGLFCCQHEDGDGIFLPGACASDESPDVQACRCGRNL